MTVNLTSQVLSRARELGPRPCLRFVRDGELHTFSWTEFASLVSSLLLGFDALALARGARLGILSKNRWEWLAVDLAASGRGVATVSLDPTWSDNMIVRVLNHAQADAVVVETASDVSRLRALSPRIPRLRTFISIDGGEVDGAHTLASLQALGRGCDNARLADLMSPIAADDIATVIFTGGSTGEPKGVLRTQGNALSRGWGLFPWMGDAQRPDPEPGDVLLNPLSFCHSAGRWWAQLALTRGATLALPETDSLSLRDFDLLAPTHLAAVPRVILSLQKMIAAQVWNGPADAFSEQARALLGGRLRCIVYGGGSLADELRDFFEGVGVAVRMGYGGTEAGIIAVETSMAPRGTVGVPAGADVCILDGEILVKGPAVTAGYLANAAATARALDSDGWWRTGDRGRLDDAGNLVVTGRGQAAFNCHEGTNIDPAEIEQLLEADPYMREAVIVGHRRPFIVALVVPDREALARDGAADHEAFVQARVDRINDKLESFERVRRVRLIDADRMGNVRTITGANKLRIDRAEVERAFAEELSALYRD